MADLFVPKIIDQLSNVAFKQLRESVNPVMGVEEEVKNLNFKLTTVQKFLDDAERRKLEEEDVEIWLEKLEDITYEMEDVLDEWNIKIDKPRNLYRRLPTLLDKVRSFISSVNSCVKEDSVRSEIALKIKEINDKLESLLSEANQFNFAFNHSEHVDSNTFKRPMTSFIFDELEVHGREDDKEILLGHLLSESEASTSREFKIDGESKASTSREVKIEGKSKASTSKEVKNDGVKVISIVGVVGIGKTTLAQMLFNDERVQKHFDLRKWVCVSDPFDEKRIANALLERPEKISEWETLFQLLKSTFSRKRFLLVLDDLWTEKEEEWKPFENSLKNGAPGSIILVTTRKDIVARVVGSKYTHPLGLMSDSECWSILKQIALSERPELCERVEKIGRKIAEKCKGLPLAAKTLGRLLLQKDTVEEWKEVINSKIWQMEEASIYLFPHFYLSYNELSPELKRCFSYCAVFPKNTEISVERLIRLWMAQGFLGPQSQTDQDMLNVNGREYFKKLAMRSFFQECRGSVFDENVILSCKMHDIVLDFAKFLTKNECRAFDEVDCQRVKTKGGSLSKERVRHLTLLGETKSLNSSVVSDIGKVRSFFNSKSHNELPQDLFRSLKSVKSLTLSRRGLQKIPPEIESLIHLRCLDVSDNPLKELPETVCNLYFLESLDVSVCEALERLPQRIGDLVHLRYLLNYETWNVKEMPRGLEKLTLLWNLGWFVADGRPLNHLGKLKHLNQLEELRISVRGQVDFESAQLGEKIYLRYLELYFEGEGIDVENTRSIETMEPPPNLQQLLFVNYPRSQLPKWIVEVESIINNLTVLYVYGADIFSVPILGKLPSLQFLCLGRLRKLKQIGGEFYGLPDDDSKAVVFPSLRKLYMSSLENWERWEDISEGDEGNWENDTVSIMPRLETLVIFDCNVLEALPNWLIEKSSSSQLWIFDCRKLLGKYPVKNGALRI